MIDTPEHYEAMEVKTFAQLQRYWPVYLESLEKLNELTKTPVSEETYLKAALNTMMGGRGVVPVVHRRGEGEIVACGIAMDTTNEYHEPSLLIYSVYAKACAPKVIISFFLPWIQEWAVAHGFKELHAWSPRINGAAYHLFEGVWGFERKAIFFTKPLCKT